MLSLALLSALFAGQAPEPERPGVQRPSRLSVEWRGPASCPDQDELDVRLRERLPGVDQALEIGETPLRATALVTLEDERFELRLRLVQDQQASERVLASEDCSLLADTLVLILAVTVDPVATAASVRQDAREAELEAEREEASPLPDPEPGSTAASTSISTAAATATTGGGLGVEEQGRTRGFKVGVRALAGGGFGPTNAAHASLGGSLAVIGSRWRVAVDGRWVVPRSVIRPDGVGGSFDGWMLGALGCFVPSAGPVELPLCGGLEGGRVRGEGVPSLVLVERAAITVVAFRLTPGLAWVPIERLSIGLDLDLALPLTRGEFVVDALVIQRVAALNVRGMLGIELRI